MSCTDDTLLGSTCTFACDPRHDLVGAVRVTCLAGGRWSDEAPSCQRFEECPRPVPERGQRHNCSGLRLGAVCRFGCQPGGRYLLSGEAELRCVRREGASDGADSDGLVSWSGRQPRCIGSYPAEVAAPKNNEISVEKTPLVIELNDF